MNQHTENGNTVIHSEQKSLARLYHAGRFEVPWHQRRYDWEGGHVLDLLNDINEAIATKQPCYFLGAIMLVKGTSNVWQINDGQQRLVTISLICARLCRLFHENHDNLREHHALRILFNISETGTETLAEAEKFEPRILPPQDDKMHFSQLIRGNDIGSNGKLTSAWKEIDTFFSGTNLEKAKEIFDFLLSKTEVACLYIPQHVDPNSVFETLNARGKQLDEFDLVRNHLYSFFNDASERVRREEMHNGLENIRTSLSSDTKTTEYARCYFQYKYGFIHKDRFYRGARDKIRSDLHHVEEDEDRIYPPDYIFSLATDLSRPEHIQLYSLITRPTMQRFVEQFIVDSKRPRARPKRNILTYLSELKSYKVVWPVTFALLHRYISTPAGSERKDVAIFIDGAMRNITSFIMRTAFVAPKFEPYQFEAEFANFAHRIYTEYDIGLGHVTAFLESCDDRLGFGIMDDARFINRLKTSEMKGSTKIKAFFAGINTNRQSDVGLINYEKSNVEHILPQGDVHWDGWTQFKDHRDWVHRIGNLTLLGTSDNRPGAGANKNYEAKIPYLSRSAIQITSDVAAWDRWSPDAINERQRLLAKEAAKVWSFV